MSDEHNVQGTRTLTGDAARQLIEEQIAAHRGGIQEKLAPYEPKHTVRKWHEIIRLVEEFINLPLFHIDDAHLMEWLLSFPLDASFARDPEPRLMAIRQALEQHFEPAVLDRYLTILRHTAIIAYELRMQGWYHFGAGITLNSIGAAVAYYQSRRRHIVSLLYTMPRACKGSARLSSLDYLNALLPVIEASCITITSLHHKRALVETIKDYSLEVDAVGAMGSHAFDALEGGFLEPERASIVAMQEFRRDQIVQPTLERVDPRKIFSVAEFRNDTKYLAAAYAAYDSADNEFMTMAAILEAVSRHARDDYYIHIPRRQFKKLLESQSAIDPASLERLLVNSPSDYATNTNAYEPFIDLGDLLVSNIGLLSRFLYAFKNIHLGSRRRFQIHAGFIFEAMVKKELVDMGFSVTDIKRIDRKEFDVVATRGTTIYNLQCKNNWIDLNKVESNLPLYLRYNRNLVNYYRRALEKEVKRELILKTELGLGDIRHYVISRFPVMGADPRVINYNQIRNLQNV